MKTKEQQLQELKKQLEEAKKQEKLDEEYEKVKQQLEERTPKGKAKKIIRGLIKRAVK